MDDKELMATEFPQMRWPIEGLLPEGAGIVAGKAKSGKSWWAYKAAIDVADGTPFLGQYATHPGDVLYLALEDSYRRMRERYKMLAPDRVPNGRLEIETSWPNADDGGYQQLEMWLGDHPQAQLVVIDNMRRFDAAGYAYRRDSAVIQRAVDMAHKHRVCILLVFHMYKGPGVSKSSPDWMDKVQGSVGVTGAADFIIGMYRDRNGEEGVMRVTGKDVPEHDAPLVFDKAKGLWSLANIGLVPEVEALTDARKEVLDVVIANPGQTATWLGDHVFYANGQPKRYNGIKAQLWAMLASKQLVRHDGLYFTPVQIEALSLQGVVEQPELGSVAQTEALAWRGTASGKQPIL